ncbi:glycophorin-C-like [Hyperolius riggenbachi]|uniref:glycophorin-C-like n=1 Tax=Hyperolius riggenbachi TaxID=752182 RepID=UPI0035A2D4E6
MADYNKSDSTLAPPHDLQSRDDIVAIIIGGVVAAVILVLVVLIVVVLSYLYKHKGTYFTNEAKGTEFTDGSESALKGDHQSLQDSIDESKKEYFI